MKDGDKMSGGGQMCGTDQEAMKASVRSSPSGSSSHNNPQIMPIGPKAMTGANYG